eukprot:TRINITY_DN2046_c2_g1_i1.p1 TRINITY_DN2046_c2_g1~~TRINITY_DN2046_c2_g1_i1.p1  ORF type:complete len:1113 (+),score=397.60 TRINITY_DN2046_c2_g1_i1:245-3583(+)
MAEKVAMHRRSLSLPAVGPHGLAAQSRRASEHDADSRALGPGKGDVVQLVRNVKAHFKNSMLCREGLLALQRRIFGDGGREAFQKFVLNATGGLSVLLAAMEHHLADAMFLEVGVQFLCNVTHYGGKRQPRVVSKVIKKGGSKLVLSVINVHKASNYKIFHAACSTVCAIAVSDTKIATMARLSGCLSTLLSIIKSSQGAPEVLVAALSCLCALTGRCDSNVVVLGKKGAIQVLCELVGRCLSRAVPGSVGSAALRAACKALLIMTRIDDNVALLVREGCVLTLVQMLSQPQGPEVTKLALDVLRQCTNHHEGQAQLEALGGTRRIVDLVMAANADKQGEALLDVVLHLFKFHDACELPLNQDIEISTSQNDCETGTPPDEAPPAEIPDTFTSELRLPELLESPFAPLHATQHVRPFTAPRPSPSCASGMDYAPEDVEELYQAPPGLATDLIRHELRRLTHPHETCYAVAYDDTPRPADIPVARFLPPIPPQAAPLRPPPLPMLSFSSHFESGNLKRALRVYPDEYDLILNSDLGSAFHMQWFYFSVENMVAGRPYKFNVINMEKPGSLFGEGQRPLLFSEKEFTRNGIGWVRTGSNICYMRNAFRKRDPQPGDIERAASADRRRSKAAKDKDEPAASAGLAMRRLDTRSQGTYCTCTFTITFQHDGDRCYIAYSYPYTFSDLQQYLRALPERIPQLADFFTNQVLCRTVGGNVVNLLTVTNLRRPDGELYTPEEVASRKVVFITARVHPGETCASWMAKGIVDFLCDPHDAQARFLRDRIVWKIVPMLNPDGVINGNHRCSLTCRDLNREWAAPSRIVSPPIFHLKRLMKHIKVSQGRSVLMFCDFHGHSRRMNFFMYGCNVLRRSQLVTPSVVLERVLPKVMADLTPSFSFDASSFKVQKVKESTGRIVVWKELGVRLSYTLEASLCGSECVPILDEASLDGSPQRQRCAQRPGHYNTRHYASMGLALARKVCAFVCPEGDPLALQLGDVVHDLMMQLNSGNDGGGGGSGTAPADAVDARSGVTATSAGSHRRPTRGSQETRPSAGDGGARALPSMPSMDRLLDGDVDAAVAGGAFAPVVGDDDDDDDDIDDEDEDEADDPGDTPATPFA